MVAYNFKIRFEDPILVGLGRQHEIKRADVSTIHPKMQTIRENGKRRHARPGENVQLYYGMRTKQCRLIGVARCTEVLSVIIWPKTGAIILEGQGILTPRALNKLARADGFLSILDMMAFWQENHAADKFEGKVIRWEPIK